ncbi:MAG: SRPBCC family protein [Pontixanthobacter sp.]
MRKSPIILAALAGLLPVSAQAEVVAEAKDAFVVRNSAVVKADLRETWLALISPAKWWNSAHTFSGKAANMTLMPQAGGCFCELIPAEDTVKTVGLAGSVEHMTVLLSIPDQALRMRGALGPLQSEPVEGIMTITLSKEKAGTKIVFEYAVGGYMRFEVPVISKAVDGVMTLQLTGLADVLGVVEAPKSDAKPAKAPAASEKQEVKPEPPKPEPSKPEPLKPEPSKNTKASAGDKDAKPAEPKISVDEAFGDLTGDN